MSNVKIATIVKNRTLAELQTYGAETVKESLNGYNSEKVKSKVFESSQLKRAFTLGASLHSIRNNWKENKEKLSTFYSWATEFCGLAESYIKVFINLDIKKVQLANATGIEDARAMMKDDNKENVDAGGMLIAPIKKKKEPVVKTPEEKANAIMKRIAELPTEYIEGIRDALTESLKSLKSEDTDGIQEKTEAVA